MIDLDSDLDVLTATLWGEARGESLAGIEAVASVIVNRVAAVKVRPKRKQFGDGSWRSACLRPWQFSCWNRDDPNRAKLMGLDLETPKTNDLALCLLTAEDAIAGRLADSTHGALFYKVTSLPWPKDWGQEVEPIYEVGHHSFYRLEE